MVKKIKKDSILESMVQDEVVKRNQKEAQAIYKRSHYEESFHRVEFKEKISYIHS